MTRYVVERVVRPSGGHTFRAGFGGSSDVDARDELIAALSDLGCAFEWYSEHLIAIDARSASARNRSLTCSPNGRCSAALSARLAGRTERA